MARDTVSNREEVGVWTPRDIPGMAMRVRSIHANGGGASDDDAVTHILEEVRGNHFAQATPSAQPVYKTDIANGKPAIRFVSGGNDQIASIRQMPSNVQFIYWVGTYSPALPFSGTTSAITANAATPGDPGVSGQNATSNIFSYGNAWFNGVAQVAMPSDPTTPFIVFQEDTSPSHSYSGGVMLGRYGTSGAFWPGDFFEAGIYTSSVSSADRALLLTYLSEEYGISV